MPCHPAQSQHPPFHHPQRQRSSRGRSSRRSLISLLLAVAAALTPLAGAGLVRAQVPGAGAGEPAAGGRSSSAAAADLVARQAAERILSAVSRGDARAYYKLLAPESQRVSSPAMVAEAFRTLPKLRSWTITEIAPGLESSSVAVQLQTSAGAREVLLILDGSGRMENFTINASDQSAEAVVREFMTDLANGRYISAGSHLTPELLEEITPAALQRRWQQLQRITGDFNRIDKIWKAESNATMKLVIVTARFNRLTDNLFVVLNGKNQIASVNFPSEPNAPADALP